MRALCWAIGGLLLLTACSGEGVDGYPGQGDIATDSAQTPAGDPQPLNLELPETELDYQAYQHKAEALDDISETRSFDFSGSEDKSAADQRFKLKGKPTLSASEDGSWNVSGAEVTIKVETE